MGHIDSRKTLGGRVCWRGKSFTDLIGSSKEPAPTLLAPVSLKTGERGGSLFLRKLLQGA